MIEIAVEFFCTQPKYLFQHQWRRTLQQH